MTFWNEGTFARIGPVQEVGVLLRWNNSKRLDKELPYVCNLLFLATKFNFQYQSPNCRVGGYKFRSVYCQVIPGTIQVKENACIAIIDSVLFLL